MVNSALSPQDLAILDEADRRGLFGLNPWLKRVTPSFNWDWKHLIEVQKILDSIEPGKPKYIILMIPVRHGKTELATLRYPIKRIAGDESTRVVAAGYNQEFANRFGRRTRRLAQEIGVRVSNDRAAANEWETAAGGGFRSVGVGGGVTGQGFDLLMVDDPVKSREEAESEAYRERVWGWFTSDLWTRREPGASVVVTMSRWHEDDLVGRILASEMAHLWEVIHLPALAEENDPLGREFGEALCPERYDEAALLQTKAVIGEYAFESLYQQNPRPRQGAWIQADKIRKIKAHEVPAHLPRVRRWDLGASYKGDPSAGVLMSGPDHHRRTYICDVKRFDLEPAERNDIIDETAREDGRQTIIRVPQDPGAGGKEAAQNIVRMLLGWPVQIEIETSSKELRAEPFAAAVNAGLVYMVEGPWNDALISELKSFPLGKHDDQVDACAGAFNHLARAIRIADAPIPPLRGTEEWYELLEQRDR